MFSQVSLPARPVKVWIVRCRTIKQHKCSNDKPYEQNSRVRRPCNVYSLRDNLQLGELEHLNQSNLFIRDG